MKNTHDTRCAQRHHRFTRGMLWCATAVVFLGMAGGQQQADRSTMVLVQGGSFEMGGGADKPVHTVTVSDFYIDTHEVTVKEYRKYCDATKQQMPDAPSWDWHDDDPIVGVTWADAVEYAQWAGKRLPTEAEWEYAARGGSKSRGTSYSGSNDLDDVAWHAENSSKKTHAVGTKAPNELGLYDMSGNAAEWCFDWYDGKYYAFSPKTNPRGPDVGRDRVVRGGSYAGDQYDCLVTFRRSALPERQMFRNGFRCALDK